MIAQQGFFITLEGGEGTGKSTLAKSLQHYFENKGHEVVLTREPGGTKFAEELRQILLARKEAPPTALTEALLFSAARADHVAEVIRPALASGKIVICDRYADSTRAYQGYLGGVNLEDVVTLEAICTGRLKPHITLLIDLDPEIGLKRAIGRTGQADRFEREAMSFHQKLRAAYLDIAKQEPERVAVLDGAKTPEELHQMALKTLAARLPLPQN